MNDWIPQLIRALEILGVAAIVALGGTISAILQHRSNMKRLRFEQRFKVGEHKYAAYEKRILILQEQMSKFANTIGTAIGEVVNPENIAFAQLNVEKTKAFVKTFTSMIEEAPDMMKADLQKEDLLDKDAKEDIIYIRRVIDQNIDDINESNADEKLVEFQRAMSKLYKLADRFLEKKRDELFDKLLE